MAGPWHVAAAPCPERSRHLCRGRGCSASAQLSPTSSGPAVGVVYVSLPAQAGHKLRALLPNGCGDRTGSGSQLWLPKPTLV